MKKVILFLFLTSISNGYISSQTNLLVGNGCKCTSLIAAFDSTSNVISTGLAKVYATPVKPTKEDIHSFALRRSGVFDARRLTDTKIFALDVDINGVVVCLYLVRGKRDEQAEKLALVLANEVSFKLENGQAPNARGTYVIRFDPTE